MAIKTHNYYEKAKKQPGTARAVSGSVAKPETTLPLVTQAARALANPASMIPTDVLALQRTSGNRAVTGLIQTKLTVDALPDCYEQKADRVAAHKSGFAVDAETEQHLAASKGKGSPLPADVRVFMESRFGADLSGVRLHTDRDADQLNRTLRAQAFTHGQDIYLGAGKYDPASTEGQRLLAHELTHAIQQGTAKLTKTPRVKPARSASIQLTAHPHDRVQRILNPLEWWQQGKEARKGVKEAKTRKGKAGTVMDALAGGLQGDQREEVSLAGLYGATMSGPEGKEFKPTGKFSDFLDQDAPSGIMNTAYVAQGAGQTLSGVMNIGRGINQQRSGSRFQQHTGAKKIEGGLSNILGGVTGAGSGIEGMVGDTAKTMVGNIPVLDVVYNYTLAGLKGKETVEDAAMATAMGVHSRQLEKKKRGAMHNLPEFNRMRSEELKQNYKQARQDVLVLEQKAKMGQNLSRTEQAKIRTFKDKYRSYEGYREAQKTAKFIGKRKAESATVKGIETAGYALDATGTFTAAADLGATKATGKLLKFGASGYRGLRTLGERAKKVHGLRKAKNLLEYGGKSSRGIGWGARQFFFGNVDKQREKLQKGIDEPEKIGGQFYTPGKKIKEEYGSPYKPLRGLRRRQIAGRLEKGVNAQGQSQNRWARISALAQEKNKARYGGKTNRGMAWKLRQYLTPGTVTGKTKGFRQALAHGTTGKTMAMTPEKAVAARRLATTTGERRLEQLLKGMQSSNPEVQKEHLRIYNTMVGGSVGGALSLAHRGLAKPEDVVKWDEMQGQTEAEKEAIRKRAEADKNAITRLFEKETSL